VLSEGRTADRVQDVLDVLPVTDNVYHHLAYTRPLVDALVDEVRRHTRTGRVLVIGPNELLPQVLIHLGYEVELWVLDGLPLSEVLQRRASRFAALDDVLSSPADQPADVILAPYVAEATALDPGRLLVVLGASLQQSGRLVMVSRQPGELTRRLRTALSKSYAGARDDRAPAPSPTWPALPARRVITKRDLIQAGGGRFTTERLSLVTDHRACLTTQALSLPKWLGKEAIQLAKHAVPAFRDCWFASFVTSAPPA
jgi:hypothetical protein